MNKTMNRILPIMCLGVLSFFTMCSDDDEGNIEESLFDTTLESAITNYSDIVLANYQDAKTSAESLKIAIDALVSNPTEATLDAAKEAWLDSRVPYGQTEAFRFYGGPIDDEDGPEGQLNAWPLDESYVDYVLGATNGDDLTDNSGTNIINSPDDFPTISKEVIVGLNEADGETNVSTGYHAIEFLLWGQDTSTGAGGGNRPFTDFVSDGTGTGGNQARRGEYLQAAVELVIDDLESLIAEWQVGGSYRTTFTAEDHLNTSLEAIISALGKLSKGELAGERMIVAWTNRSKEDEHSCFSDNTHVDILMNAKGIQNVFNGSYTRLDGSVVSGTSIYDVVAVENIELATQIRSTMTASVAASDAIQAPFDQEILNDEGRVRVEAAFNVLRTQGDELADAAEALGFTFDPEDI